MAALWAEAETRAALTAAYLAVELVIAAVITLTTTTLLKVHDPNPDEIFGRDNAP